MRNGQNKRMRGRNRSKGQNPLTRVYESNGPDVKIRGTANHVAEKYVQLARDAQSSGDPVAAENYFQHAEHYFRLIATVQEQFRLNNPYAREGEGYDESDDDGGDQPIVTGEPYAPREQNQPYPPRDSQPYQQRENRYPPREQNHQPREQNHSPREQNQPYPPRQQTQESARGDEAGDIDRLPAFVTGGAGAPNGAPPIAYSGNGHEGGGGPDRFPLHRRRRRRHGAPRSDNQTGGEAGDTQPVPRPSGE